ncbi:FapA family protein, partial [Tyzzerella sp. OttesenSCG-928-J15]|nr:FapA family protein [Tyzzerella sp. OttesenSCG-928-J15]
MSGLDRSSMITPLDEKATVSFSADKTEAYISFSEPRNAGSMLTPDKIKKIIEENNVVHGIDEELVNKIMQGPRVYDHLYTIAKGQKSVDGKNGEIEYLFNFSKKSLSPKMNADGTVDYRNLNLIEMVEKGQVVARAIPPTEGQRGINVFGKEIAANDGRPAPSFPKGKNVVVSGDGAELIAEATGQIVMVNGSVSISEILEIKGNVDNSTGNIDFNGSVVVNGSVIQGFRITCLGNIEVKGSVEGAEIECPG